MADAEVAEGPAQRRRDDEPTERRGHDYDPRGVERKTGLWPTLKRTALEFQEDNLSDWAASLTYYGLLALFPAIIVLVSIVGLVADPESTTQTLTDIVTKAGPDTAAQTFAGPIQQVTQSHGTAGFARASVSAPSRVPRPPASTMASVWRASWAMVERSAAAWAAARRLGIPCRARIGAPIVVLRNDVARGGDGCENLTRATRKNSTRVAMRIRLDHDGRGGSGAP